MKQDFVFLISFVIALLWYRVFLALVPKYAQKPFLRTALNLRWHHWHHGVILVFLGVLVLLASGTISIALILLGIGLGFLTDEFVWFLLLETERDKELEVYKKSLVPTLLVGLVMGILILMIILLKK